MRIDFWKRVEPMFDDRGCWEWTGSVARTGYGTVGTRLAHRIVYALERGPIPAGLHVLHRCDNRTCVNPRHLFLGTNYDNIVDREQKGRGRGAAPTCQRGHLFDEVNTRWSYYRGGRRDRPYMRRVCRTCVRLRGRERPFNSGAPEATAAAEPMEQIG